jgi:hypothetical protein
MVDGPLIHHVAPLILNRRGNLIQMLATAGTGPPLVLLAARAVESNIPAAHLSPLGATFFFT